MAEEISNGQFKLEMLQFKTEMMRFAETASKKFDGLTADVRTNSFKLDKFDARFDILDERFAIQGEQLRIIDGRLSDVASKVI